MSLKSKISKIKKLSKELEKESDVRFIFSYIQIGDTLNDLKSETISSISDDIASKALCVIIDEGLYGESNKEIENKIEDMETISKLHMFNIFNKENPEA